MKRLLGPGVALSLLLTAAGCELLPRHPLAELEPPPPLPQPTTTWSDLGRELLAADQPDQAYDAFIRSLRVEGVTATALTGAGVAAERQGLLTEARRYFEQASLLAPGSVTVQNNLGAVLYRLGELHDARNAFQAALMLSNGTSEMAARNLSISEIAIRRADVAAARRVGGPALNPHRLERVGPARYRLSEADPRGTHPSSEISPGPDRPALRDAPFSTAGLLQIQEDG
jgi:tetratricopeptide (TPR) repeat protein